MGALPLTGAAIVVVVGALVVAPVGSGYRVRAASERDPRETLLVRSHGVEVKPWLKSGSFRQPDGSFVIADPPPSARFPARVPRPLVRAHDGARFLIITRAPTETVSAGLLTADEQLGMGLTPVKIDEQGTRWRTLLPRPVSRYAKRIGVSVRYTDGSNAYFIARFEVHKHKRRARRDGR